MIPGKLAGRFERVGELGGSHHSRIFELRDRSDGARRILKCVPKSLIAFFEAGLLRKEFERLALLRHPHLVRVLDYGEDEEAAWLLSEKVDGVPLDDPGLSGSEKDLTERALVLLDALTYLHERGIIHHDVKPANVLIARDGSPASLKLIDLGLATQRYARRSGQPPRGTEGYLAPELFSPASIDHRVDLYAAGMMFRRLSGERAGTRFRQWVERMTARRPEERFATARAARAWFLSDATSEARLEPYLLDSLPWVQCRGLFRELLSKFTVDSSLRYLLYGASHELEAFGSTLKIMLTAAGVNVSAAASDEDVDPTRTAAQERRALLVGEGPNPIASHRRTLSRWVAQLAGGNVLWMASDRSESPPGNWTTLELEPLSAEESSRIVEAIHPELHVEPPLLREFHRKTEGDPSQARALLQRILSSRPTLEQFRQALLEAVTAPHEPGSRSDRGRPGELAPRMLAWAEIPLPLEWFEPDDIPVWVSQGAVRHFQDGGRDYLQSPFVWRSGTLEAADLEWLRSRLDPLPNKLEGLERAASLSIRAGLDPQARLATGRLVAKLFRLRRYERALLWFERLASLAPPVGAESTKARLLLETGRLAQAKPLIARLSSPARERLGARLAFLEGRFSECPPTPEVRVHLGQYAQAYRDAREAISRPHLPARKRADLERVSGLAALYEGRIEAALEHLKNSLAQFRKLRDPDGYTPALNQLGMALAKRGKKKEAARCYRHAAALAMRRGDRRRALIYLTNLASAQLDLGDLASALRNFERGKTACRLLGLTAEGTSITQNLANIAVRTGRLDLAASLLAESSAALADSENRVLRIYQGILEADLALGRGETERYRSVVEELASRFAAGTLPPAVRVLKAEAAYQKGDLRGALRQLEESGAGALHRGLLRSEWEWNAGTVSARELVDRYRKLGTLPAEEGDFFTELKRLRFLGLLSRAGGLDGDLRTESVVRRKRIESAVPPEIWGALQNRIAGWFGDAEPARSEPSSANSSQGSLSILGREGRAAVASFLRIARHVTLQPPSELLETILREVMRLTEAPRGGIVLQQKDRLESRLFLGREWETEGDLPVEFSRSVARSALLERKTILVRDARAPEEQGSFGPSLRLHALRGVLCLPLQAGDRLLGAIYLDDPERPFRLGEEEIAILEAVAAQAAVVLQSALLLEDLAIEHGRVRALNQRLEEANRRQRRKIIDLEKIRTPYGTGHWARHGIVGESAAIRRTMEAAEAVAGGPTRVVLVGEIGTEKEAIARAVVRMSDRAEEPFIVVDGSAVAPDLFESELFGHEAGAFTGAVESRAGLLRSASTGTVLLQSIEEVPPLLQAKLLRVLQEGKVRPVGSTVEIEIGTRFLAAFDRSPRELVAEGKLREDLYYRLAVFEIFVPPLRDRREDIAHLARHFLVGQAAGRKEGPPRLSRGTLRVLESYDWPGNVRELMNELQRASLGCGSGVINVDHLSDSLRSRAAQNVPLPRRGRTYPKLKARMERRILVQALKESKGNRKLAAQNLGIPLSTLYRRLKELNVGPEPARS